MKPRNLTIKENELYLHEYSLTSLAKTYKTPLYVYDEDELHYKMQLFKKYFRSPLFETEVVYASKAFLTPAICDIAKEEGLMMDAVSLGDLSICKQANYALERIVFHGNNKSKEELEFAVEHQVGIIVVDNLYELRQLIAIAKEKEKCVHTLFRVNPGIDAHTHKYIQTALYVSKFGESIYDLETMDNIIQAYQSSSYVQLLGFHAHIGSQIKDMKPFLLCADKMITFTKEMEERYQMKLPYLNLGGGFGINYQESDPTLDLSLVLSKMIQRIEAKCKKLQYHVEKVFIEPGRSIVGTAGITLYECGIVKRTYGGKNYLFIDGGMTDNIRPALYQAIYTVDVANRMNEEKNLVVDVAGKCCESGDVIAHSVQIPQTKPGDILAVYATGAYTYSMSSNYNSLTRPAVILVGKKVKVISRRETLQDLNKLF